MNPTRLVVVVKTEAEAERWLRECVAEIGGGFHPDTPARDYVVHCQACQGKRGKKSCKTCKGTDGDSMFTPDECKRFDRARMVAYRLLGDRCYEVGLAEMQARGFAPKPGEDS